MNKVEIHNGKRYRCKFKDGGKKIGELARILWEDERASRRERERGMMGWKEREGHLGGWRAINKANEMTCFGWLRPRPLA